MSPDIHGSFPTVSTPWKQADPRVAGDVGVGGREQGGGDVAGVAQRVGADRPDVGAVVGRRLAQRRAGVDAGGDAGVAGGGAEHRSRSREEGGTARRRGPRAISSGKRGSAPRIEGREALAEGVVDPGVPIGLHALPGGAEPRRAEPGEAVQSAGAGDPAVEIEAVLLPAGRRVAVTVTAMISHEDRADGEGSRGRRRRARARARAREARRAPARRGGGSAAGAAEVASAGGAAGEGEREGEGGAKARERRSAFMASGTRSEARSDAVSSLRRSAPRLAAGCLRAECARRPRSRVVRYARTRRGVGAGVHARHLRARGGSGRASWYTTCSSTGPFSVPRRGVETLTFSDRRASPSKMKASTDRVRLLRADVTPLESVRSGVTRLGRGERKDQDDPRSTDRVLSGRAGARRARAPPPGAARGAGGEAAVHRGALAGADRGAVADHPRERDP